MSNPTVVTVTFESSTNTVSISDTLTSLAQGGSIEWNFIGLPASKLGCIRFQAPSPPLGPFQAMEVQTNQGEEAGNIVVGMGNTGAPGQYQYKAMVLDVAGQVPATFSSVGIVDNLSEEKDLSPDAIVVFDQVTQNLTVTPLTLELEPGRTANWHIFGVPGDHFVTFNFDEFPDPLTGPFSSFFLSTTMGFQACGENFDHTKRSTSSSGSSIQYEIRVRKPDGTLAGPGEDPLIATLGDPPPHPSEES